MSLEWKKLLMTLLSHTPGNGHSSQTDKYSFARILDVNPETLVRTVEDLLIGSREAVVMEDGAIAFDLARSKYSISGERNKCVLHLWSSERNVVRRVIEAEVKNEVLRLEVQRLGQARPSKLEICRERDRRTPTAKRAARVTYSRTLQRVLEKKFRGYTVAKLTTAMDL